MTSSHNEDNINYLFAIICVL